MIPEVLLKSLSLEELRQARTHMDGLIQQKENEGRFGAWVLEGWMFRLEAFPESDYLKAVDALVETAKAMERAGEKPQRRQLSLVFSLLPESEYHRLVRPA
jgi:hypothetical protein